MQEHKDKIIELYKSKNCEEISKIYHTSIATIYRWLKKWGINTAVKRINCDLLQHKDKIIELYKSKNDCGDIAKIFNTKPYIIRRWLNRWGISTKENKYLFNKKESVKKQRSIITKSMFNAGIYNEFIQKGIDYGKSDINRAATSKRSKLMWQDHDMRQKLTDISRQNWYKNEQWKKMKCFKDTKPEIIIERALQYLNVEYKKHYQIEKWNIDFFIPSKSILLDVDGEYWHGRLSNYNHDQVKYVCEKDIKKNEYLATLKDYKYIRWWETATFDRINLITRLANLLDISIDKIEYNLHNLVIKEIQADDAFKFVNLFHYHGSLNQSMSSHGAFLNDKLVGVVVYSKPNYDNEANEYCLELSRFCLDPKYQIKNAASYIISKSLKLLGKDVISFADTTQGHDGTIYKASNFIKVGETSQSYYYVDEYNNKFHKKVIYNHARSLKVSLDKYVKDTNLTKIKEEKKIKYLYKAK